MAYMCECNVCHNPFRAWINEDNDLEEDICYLCNLDNQDQTEIDGLMGGQLTPSTIETQQERIVKNEITQDEIDYPINLFNQLINGSSPYAFYIFQWVPYQTDARCWRLKMLHDVKTFDGREALGIWPNGSSCGPFKDSEVEFIRISKEQHNGEYKDPRDNDLEAEANE